MRLEEPIDCRAAGMDSVWAVGDCQAAGLAELGSRGCAIVERLALRNWAIVKRLAIVKRQWAIVKVESSSWQAEDVATKSLCHHRRYYFGHTVWLKT